MFKWLKTLFNRNKNINISSMAILVLNIFVNLHLLINLLLCLLSIPLFVLFMCTNYNDMWVPKFFRSLIAVYLVLETLFSTFQVILFSTKSSLVLYFRKFAVFKRLESFLKKHLNWYMKISTVLFSHLLPFAFLIFFFNLYSKYYYLR